MRVRLDIFSLSNAITKSCEGVARWTAFSYYNRASGTLIDCIVKRVKSCDERIVNAARHCRMPENHQLLVPKTIGPGPFHCPAMLGFQAFRLNFRAYLAATVRLTCNIAETRIDLFPRPPRRCDKIRRQLQQVFGRKSIGTPTQV